MCSSVCLQHGTIDEAQMANVSMKYFRLAGAVRLERIAEGAHALELANSPISRRKCRNWDTGRGVKCTEERGGPAGQRFSVSCVKGKLRRKICRYIIIDKTYKKPYKIFYNNKLV